MQYSIYNASLLPLKYFPFSSISSLQFDGSSRVEVAHQEAVALRRQEELIREEEAAGVAENGKRDKDKRPKKKQVFAFSLCLLNAR